MAKIEFWVLGRTERGWTETGEEVFANRVGRYVSFEKQVFSDIKDRLEPEILKKKEGELVLKKLLDTDFLILLDEHGIQMGSVDFANWLQSRLDLSPKRIVFLVGGAFGFSAEIYARANHKMSISKMTFPHQLVRVLFLEQLYRAFSIIKNEPYHNQ